MSILAGRAALTKKFCLPVRFRFGLPMAQTQLTWYGQSGVTITTPDNKVLVIDPWLTNPKNPNGKDDLANLKQVDFILVTHGHSDHVGNAVEIAKSTGAKLVAGLDLATAMITVLGFPGKQAEMDTTPLCGGEVSLLDGEATVRLTPAFHGSCLGKDDDSTPVYAGQPSGMVIKLRNGPTIYHTGDTDIFSDMALISQFDKIDIMLVCIGDHFTMGPERAAFAVKLVNPKMVVPMHFATFPVLTGRPKAFEAALKVQGVKSKLRVMEIGETISL
jgi:L-ascorbate metabolism protein UlaG (beta-lactamase superfamily)